MASLALANASAKADASLITPTADRAADLAGCLAGGKEVALNAHEIWCADRGEGSKHLDAGMPQAIDPKTVCGPDDPRRLSTDIIKKLADTQRFHIAQSGIRILGAAICDDRLDLVGLDLPYSLVLDHSIFRFGIDARNFRIRNDLSVESSLVLDGFSLLRASVGGSLFARHSYTRYLSIADSDIRGSLLLSDSLLFDVAEFDRMTLAGDLTVRGSALSFLTMQHSKIGGILDLSYSEARCAYHIKKSELGYTFVVRSGFGSVAPAAAGTDPARTRLAWRRAYNSGTIAALLANPAVKEQVGDAESCAYKGFFYPAQFFMFDNTIRTSLCLQSFEWVAPAAGLDPPITFLALNGTNAGNNIVVSLWPPKPEVHDSVDKDLHKFEAVGIGARAFIFDFAQNARPYFTFVDGLKFERIHSAVIQCDAQATGTSQPAAGPEPRTTIASEFATQLGLPSVDEVTTWLAKNDAPTSQPYVAFIDAFERAGAGTTSLKVAKAEFEWWTGWDQRGDSLAEGWRTKRLAWFVWDDGVHATADYLRLAFSRLLGLVADFGFRPGKVAWSALWAVLGFWLIFRFLIRVVAFKPAQKDDVRSIGFLFLFDRLIPAYQIRNDNYEIQTFYVAGTGPDASTIRYLGKTISYVPASPRDARRAEICLDIVKAIGLVLAVFLIAAVQALVAR